VAASLSILAFTLPLILLAALAIRLDSRGPILSREPTTGPDGRTFPRLKFRCVHVAPDRAGAERRRTFVGGLLHRTRIDELPQLLDVLRGQMSLATPMSRPMSRPAAAPRRRHPASGRNPFAR
jgi:putative colanic acid biosynthesis UDP-glucose lipid carrier transferase